jgi:ABC-type nitrate/sulfonate/bicarbonate transport system permease component
VRWRRDIVPPVVLIVVLVLGWYFVARVSGLGSFVLPSPTDVARAGWETSSLLWHAAGTTLLATSIGLILALVAGVGLAAVIDLWPFARRALYPLLVASQTIQILAIAPILVIWFGDKHSRWSGLRGPGVGRAASRHGGEEETDLAHGASAFGLAFVLHGPAHGCHL